MTMRLFDKGAGQSAKLRRNAAEMLMPYFTRTLSDAGPPATAAAAAAARAPQVQSGLPLQDSGNILALAASVLEEGAAPRGVLVCKAQVPPGGQGRIVLDLTHEAGTPQVATGLIVDDLTGPNGRIGAASVTVAPAYVELANGATVEVTITIAVPHGTPVGRYRGLFRSEIDDGCDATVEVAVGV
jgi:hypothetical protein